MASLLGILLQFLCRLCPAKYHIKRFLKRWTSLLAFLVRKISKWRFLCSTKLGTIRNPKPAELPFHGDRAGSSSVSGDSIRTVRIGGYVVAASTVPASANQQPLGCECAEPRSDPTPLTPILATFPVHPHWDLDPSTDLPSSSSHTQERSGRPTIRRQRTTSIGIDIQNPSMESLPDISINSQEFTEEPMAMDTSKQSSLDNLFLPEGRFIQLINSEQIPRYTKHDTM